MVHIPFFHADAVEGLVGASIDLAMVFHCDPYVFLDRTPGELAELYRCTIDRLKFMRGE